MLQILHSQLQILHTVQKLSASTQKIFTPFMQKAAQESSLAAFISFKTNKIFSLRSLRPLRLKPKPLTAEHAECAEDFILLVHSPKNNVFRL